MNRPRLVTRVAVARLALRGLLSLPSRAHNIESLPRPAVCEFVGRRNSTP